MSLLVGVALAISPWAGGADASAAKSTVKIGEQVANFSFKDIRFLERSVTDLGDKQAYVFVFTTLDCPVVNRYLPKLAELDAAYRDQGVQFVAINAGPNDTIREAAYQAIKANLEFPIAKDFDGVAVQACGVERVPQVVVLDAERKLRYRGRIDSQYRVSGVQPNTGREDLKLAIEDVLAGRDVAVEETPVDGCRITAERPAKLDFQVTYAEHIAPILQKHCQECHRPGSTGPFALLTYDDAVGHADTLWEVVREQRMPPVYASDEQEKIVNRHVLAADERNLLDAWVHSDQPQGDPKKEPAPLVFENTKWRIGEPDLVVSMPKAIKLKAEGIVPYKYVFLPHKFEADTWVKSVEIMPGNASVVHHCNLAYIMPGGSYKDAQFITGYVPGGVPLVADPEEGFKIEKGAVLVLQIHYVVTGQEESDATSVGFKFCDGPIRRQIKHHRVTTGNFAIAPNAPHYKVSSVRELAKDSTGIGMFSHMHLRGKDMTFLAHYPDGSTETLCAIPNYSFDWQIAYRWAPGQQKFPAGTKIEVIAHYDNSPFNPYNPDPTDTVREGDQTFEEMMFGFFFFTEDHENLNLTIDPKTGQAVTSPATTAQASK
jgi:thiol-disulfide isomerase/thioredoxin